MKVIFDNTTKLISEKDIIQKHLEDCDSFYGDFKERLEKTFCRPFSAQALGDSIAWSSFVIRLYHIDKNIKVDSIKEKDGKVMNEVFGFDHKKIKIGRDSYTKVSKLDCYSYKFLPSTLTWGYKNSKVICYQFDTNKSEDKQFKSIEDKLSTINALKNRGFKLVELSNSLSLEECQKMLSMCKFFVGICSGMSHLAHCVGTPVHLICNGRSIERVKLHHGNNARGPVYFHQLPRDFVKALNENTL